DLFRGIREAEQIQRDARGWTGRLVEEARRREIPWSRLEGETGAPKSTLHRRTLPPLEFDDDE
uniref:hypothetical protein n=1 Tax=Salmonella enterica TaxID=28901 RepID=UPI0032987720